MATNCVGNYYFLKLSKVKIFLYLTLDIVPTRLSIALSIFFALVFLFMVRSNFSIAILAMVQPIQSGNGTQVQVPDVSKNFTLFYIYASEIILLNNF